LQPEICRNEGTPNEDAMFLGEPIGSLVRKNFTRIIKGGIWEEGGRFAGKKFSGNVPIGGEAR